MSGFGGRGHRGRRDNGLDAVEFVALGDVDPRIGEHLLDVLGIVGIAGYLAPSADLNPVVRATTLPSRPTDRLWVDRERLDEARGLLEAVEEDDAAGESLPVAPTLARTEVPLNIDAEWERIVAAFEASADASADRADGPGRPDGPAGPDGSTGRAEQSRADANPRTSRRYEGRHDDTEPDQPTAPPEGTEAAGVRTRGEDPGLPHPATQTSATVEDAPSTDDEGYTPPVPPPLPRVSGQVGLALVAIAVGLLLFFRPSLLPVDVDVTLVLAVGAIFGGVGSLVYRLRDGWNDDDPDDRAVV